MNESRFLAIDFETANYQPDSACAIGLARVENGSIVHSESFLIKPPYKDFYFTYIHGLTWRDVASAPDFGELWETLKPFFNDIDFIVAHNSGFDKGVLTACCRRYNIAPPQIDFKCTVHLSRKVLKYYPANLPAVCSNLGIQLNHHDALSDTLACANIMIHILRQGEISA